jgi:hypothetical protein
VLIESVQRAVIECKVLKGSREKIVGDGTAQVYKYADRCGAKEAHLVIFDRTAGRSWDEKIFNEIALYSGNHEQPAQFPVTVWGM